MNATQVQATHAPAIRRRLQFPLGRHIQPPIRRPLGALRPLAVAPPSVHLRMMLRKAMDVEAARLVQTRREGHQVNEEQLRSRWMEFVEADLKDGPGLGAHMSKAIAGEPRADPSPLSGAPGAIARVPNGCAERARTIAELVERIELHLRGSRPALAVSLAGALGGSAEIERTASREVAIRLHGVSPGIADKLQQALSARGIRLVQLFVDTDRQRADVWWPSG